jgi:hypothetical protein
MCLGTWMGFAISVILILTGNDTPLQTNNIYLTILLHGLMSAGGVWLIHTAQEALESLTNE